MAVIITAQEAAALPPPTASFGSRRNRMVLLIGLGIFVSTFVQDQVLALLPLRTVLKNDLHATATSTAVFFFWSGLAWYFKPLFGILSDAVPLLGTRRRSYMLLGAFAATLLWIVYAFVPHQYYPFLIIIVAVNTALVIISTISGGLLVEEGQAAGATGKLSSMRNATMCVAGVIAGPIGGYLATKPFSVTAVVSAILCGALFVYALVTMRERRSHLVDRNVLTNSRIQLMTAVRSRPLLLAALFTFLITFAPGFQTPLYFYQTDTLHFSTEFIGGRLQVCSNVFGIAGSLAYALLCRRVRLRFMIVISIVASALAALGYLQYHTPKQAMVVESVYGFATNFAFVMTFDLAAMATPRGCEALAYALLMSASNLATKGADTVGSWLLDHFHLQFPQLVWINSATTLLTLLAVPLLPIYLLNHRDSAIALGTQPETFL